MSGNTSDPGQSGSGYAGGVANQGTLHLISSTIANNVAAPKGGTAGAGGNIGTQVTTVDRLNTLFVGGSPQNCYGLGGPISSPSSGDKSKASDATCVGPATAGLRLGPLQDNGGPTDTHALLTGNPAIDGGESACPTGTEPTTDQRGIARPQGKCDVGAFEVVKSANLAVTMSGSPRTVGQGAPSGITYSIKVRSTGPALDATQPVVTDALPAGTRLLHSSSSQGSCAGQRTISCRLGLLANGGSASVTLRVRVDKSLGTASNTAVVSSPRPEAAHADDRATVHTVVRPSDGNDKITGTHGPDVRCGLLGNDTIKGLAGNDKLYGDGCGHVKGKGGNDTLIGGPGDDLLVGGGGKNVIDGGSGNDTVLARNGKEDRIDCGKGKKDVAKVDKHDQVKNCEQVQRG